MKDFYYQVKTRQYIRNDDRFAEKPYIKIWSNVQYRGIVEAENSKKAREKVKNEIFDKKIIKNKDADVLLSIIEITPQKSYLKKFFEPRVCKHCGRTFDVSISDYYSSEFCCEACYETYSMMNFDINKMVQSRELNYIEFMESNPVIYRIRNKINGKNYIGQTIRSFTLRWWEHYKSWIKKQPEGIENFDFSVLEEFTKEEIKRNPDLLKQREQYWIDKYDAIENGYNSRNEVSNVK